MPHVGAGSFGPDGDADYNYHSTEEVEGEGDSEEADHYSYCEATAAMLSAAGASVTSGASLLPAAPSWMPGPSQL